VDVLLRDLDVGEHTLLLLKNAAKMPNPLDGIKAFVFTVTAQLIHLCKRYTVDAFDRVKPFPLEIPLLQKHQWIYDFYAFFNRTLHVNQVKLNKKVQRKLSQQQQQSARKQSYVYGDDFDIDLLDQDVDDDDDDEYNIFDHVSLEIDPDTTPEIEIEI
jgi:hypothetical protein